MATQGAIPIDEALRDADHESRHRGEAGGDSREFRRHGAWHSEESDVNERHTVLRGKPLHADHRIAPSTTVHGGGARSWTVSKWVDTKRLKPREVQWFTWSGVLPQPDQ